MVNTSYETTQIVYSTDKMSHLRFSLEIGHGTLGWTMACGAGRVTADIVSGRDPEINLEGLTLARFS
jgi:D-amino-acid dehydrogenase